MPIHPVPKSIKRGTNCHHRALSSVSPIVPIVQIKLSSFALVAEGAVGVAAHAGSRRAFDKLQRSSPNVSTRLPKVPPMSVEAWG